jgi:Na+-translocating membrane potential-generating system (MpsC)
LALVLCASPAGTTPFVSRADPPTEDEREAGMSAARAPLTGEDLLFAVTEAMLVFHQRHFHRTPLRAKTQMLSDDLLANVIGAGFGDVEKAMVELGRAPIHGGTRTAFQDAMQPEFIDTVQRLSGRRVMSLIANTCASPDLEVVLFLLAPEPSADGGDDRLRRFLTPQALPEP